MKQKTSMLAVVVRLPVLAVCMALGAVMALCVSCSQQDLDTLALIYADVMPGEALQLIADNQGNPSFVMLDVRTAEEFETDHLDGAVNVDYRSEDFAAEIDGLDRNASYLVYCASGARSAGAVSYMVGAEFRSLYNLLNGLSGLRLYESTVSGQ